MVRIRPRTILLALLASLAALPLGGAPAGAHEGARHVHGTLVEAHGDRLHGGDVPGYALRQDDGAVERLDGPQTEDLVGQPVAVTDYSSQAGIQGTAAPTAPHTTVAAATGLGVHSVAFVLVNFRDDARQPFATTAVKQTFSAGSASIRQFFLDQSGGRVTLQGLRDAGGDVFGWYTLPIDRPASCDYEGIAAAARTAAAGSADHVNLDLYDHVVYVFPQQGACDWAGLAYLPGSEAWINGYNDAAVIAHELGHNMGVHHAASLRCVSGGVPVALAASASDCTATEYGDGFDVMGLSTRLMSSWHRAQLGQLPAGAIATVTADGAQTVADATDETASAPRLLLIPRRRPGAPAATEYFAIETRTRFGAFDAWSAGDDGATTGITIRLVPDLATATQSYLIDTHPATTTRADAALQPGERFTDPATGVTITLDGKLGGLATLDVAMNGPIDTTPPSAAVLTVDPDATGGPLLSWTASTDDDAVGSYEIYRNGVLLGTTTAAVRTFTDTRSAGLRQATYSVTAVDRSGNRTSGAPVTVTLPDTTPPEAITWMSVGRHADGAVELRWLEAGDDRGPVSYEIRWAGGRATTTATAWTDANAPAAATTYSVRAVDGAGNLGREIVATAPARVTPQVTVVVVPAPGAKTTTTVEPAPSPSSTTAAKKSTTPSATQTRKVALKLGTGGRLPARLTLSVRGARSISVRGRGLRRSARAARMTVTVPAALRRAARTNLTVTAAVPGSTVRASYLVKRGRVIGYDR